MERRTSRRPLLLTDPWWRSLWLPIPFVYAAFALLLSAPALLGADLEDGSWPGLLVLSAFLHAAAGAAAALVPIALLRRVADRLDARPLLRRLVLLLGLGALYVVALVWQLWVAFAMSWAYAH